MSKAGFPRIIQRSVTNGTGPFQLLPSRETSFGLFRDRLVDGDVVGVMITNPGKNEWQECLCTFGLGSPDTLTVLAVIASSAVSDAAVTFTAGSKLIMLSAASYTLWAAEKLRPPVRCAVKTNQTLASLIVGATLDGLTLAANDRVALLNQTTTTEIGLYKIAASGAPTRCKDFSAGDRVNAAIVPISAGTYAGAYAFCTSVAGSDIVGTSSLTWSLSGPGVWQPLDATLTALAGANWAANSLPIGTGADTVAQTAFAANTFPARSSSGNLVAKTISDYALSLVDDPDAATARTTLGLGTAATLASDTDGTMAANSDTRVATQKAVKTYVDTAVTGLLDFKGSQDCSANPNYPAGLKGDAYLVTVAGKIGGAAGKSVDVGDVFAASANNAGGTEASVGTSWFVLEHNLVGALLAANNLSDVANAATAVNNLGGATSTGSGGLVRKTSAALVTPDIGVATATSVNKMAITAPATGSTLAVADGKTFTASNTLTLAGTDGSTLNVGAGGTLGALALKASVDLSTGDATGVLAAGRFPALTGDVTTSAGALATTIGANKVTYSQMQQVAANSLIGNSTGSTANAAAVGLTSNLKMTGGNLDTVQGIQTTSSPQFSTLGIGGAPSLYALSVTPATDANGISVNRRASGANASSYWGFFVQNPGATDSFILGQSNSNNGGPLGWIAPNDVFWYSPGGSKFGNSHPTLILDANNNVLLGGDSTSTTLKAATADIAALASVDRLNTRHAAAGNRLLALQSERGSAMYLGDDAVDFAASTGIVSVGGSDVLGIKATSLTVGHTGTALATVEGRATSGAQLAASYDATHSLTLSVDSNGDCNMAATRNIGIGITPRARFDIGLNPSLPGNLAISNFAMLGQQFSSGSMIFGYNAKADETSTDQAVVANTNGSVGYSFMRIGFNGIEWHTTTGAVTGGATASSPRAKLTTAGDLCVGSHTTALGRIDSRSTTNAQLVASYDASNSMAQQVSSTGLCTWTGAGTAKGHVFTDGVQAGTGSARAKLGGTLKTNSVNAANSGSGETDLHSYTVLANTLANDGDSLRVTMTWKTANNNNNKTIKVKFGATTVIDSAPAAANTVWATAVLMITRKSATTQVASFIFAPSVSTGWTGPYGAEVDCAETLSGSVTLKATGQGTATNDVTQIQTVVEYLPAN